MPSVERYFCNKCDYESSSTVIYGLFNYALSDEISEGIERTNGWCYECKSICPIEIIPSKDDMENIRKERMKYYNEDKLELKQKENSFIKFSSTKNRIDYLRKTIKWYEDEQIPGIELLINKMKDRDSDPKCLFCSSENIISINVPHIEELNQFAREDTKEVKNINFQHPDCGGDIFIENLAVYLNFGNELMERYYDTDGILIQESDSLKDIGKTNFKRLEDLSPSQGGPTKNL